MNYYIAVEYRKSVRTCFAMRKRSEDEVEGNEGLTVRGAQKSIPAKNNIHGPEPRGFHTCCKIERCVAEILRYMIEIDDLEYVSGVSEQNGGACK